MHKGMLYNMTHPIPIPKIPPAETYITRPWWHQESAPKWDRNKECLWWILREDWITLDLCVRSYDRIVFDNNYTRTSMTRSLLLLPVRKPFTIENPPTRNQLWRMDLIEHRYRNDN